MAQTADELRKDNLVKSNLKVRSVGHVKRNGAGTAKVTKLRSGSTTRSNAKFRLDPKLLTQIHDLMVKARVLEERMIKMYKQSEGFFWIGGPGEEAFNTCLGLLSKTGEGKDYDYWHLHYRSSASMTALGMDPMDAIRQMKNTATDPFSGGRNFSNHYSMKHWNVVPTASTIETQYATAIGTGIAQRKHGGDGLTIVTGGDAGSAEGEFASCMIWASRPGFELPILMIVTNNTWGISTAYHTQHGEANVSDRAKPFGIPTKIVDGNDVEESYFAIKEAMDYIRKERKPYMIEARVSRMYGHSSASGANYHDEIDDPIQLFEKRLESENILSRSKMDEVRQNYEAEMLEMAKKAKEEPQPDPETIYDHTYWQQKGKYW